MQAWLKEAGVSRDVVIGVRKQAQGFEAHAWLEGETADGFTEITRHTPDQGWEGSRATGGPRTTVVIPVWGDPYKALLRDAVASVLAQSRTCEVIVVDNASDGPIEPPDGAMVLRSPQRLSRGEARNFGLREVKTEFVLFLDADDLLLPGALARLESHLDADPEGAACAMSIMEGDVAASVPDRRHSVPRQFVPGLSRIRPVFMVLCAVWPLYSTQGGTLIRTGAIKGRAYADADGGEDWPLGVSLALRGVTVLEEPGLLYRRHPAGGGWSDPRTSGYLPQGASAVRARLRDDPATPRWLRVSLPLVALAQATLLKVFWPLHIRIRTKRKSDGGSIGKRRM